MTTLETTVKGSPASLYEVGRYLRDTFAAQARVLGDEVDTGRSNTYDSWECGAAEHLHTRLGQVGSGIEALAGGAEAAATAVDTLASALVSARADLAEARQIATSAGLTLTGNTIHHPGAAPSDGDTAAHDAKIAAWDRAVEKARDGYKIWYDAIGDFGSSWEENKANLATAATGVFQSAASGISLYNQSYRLLSAFNTNYEMAVNHREVDLRAIKDIADNWERSPSSSPARFYQLQDMELDARYSINGNMRAQFSEDIAKVRVGSAVSRAFAALGVVTTGYGIVQDIKDGESAPQAVASNAGGAVAGGLAAAGSGFVVGATLGSAFPIAGTVIGGVVGAGVGAVVGIWTSGVVDGVFENGVCKKAFDAGWKALGDTGKAIGDAAGAAGEAVGDAVSTAGKAIGGAASSAGRGLKNAWNSIF